MSGGGPAARRIARVTLDPATLPSPGGTAEHERTAAILDLIEAGGFAPAGCADGPYHLLLRLEDNRLVLDIRDAADRPQRRVTLPLSPFRRLLRDYHQIVDTHHSALRHAPAARIEAIDMGRRGLHNEAAALLRTRLEAAIALEAETARRLFTLLSALHRRG